MKVFFLCKYLSTGGAERVCVDIANGLSERGHQVTILTDIGKEITYPPISSVRLVDCKMTNRYRNVSNNFRQMFKMFRKEKPDVVISILYVRSLTAKLASILTCGCPIVASDHSSFERPKGYHLRFVLRLDKFYFNYIYDYLTLLTKADLDFLKGRFKNKSRVMYNPLSFEPLKYIPNKEKTILAVGRISAWEYKGFDLLIQAWNMIAHKYPDWTLRIIGHGNEKTINFLKNLAPQIKNIEFKSYTTQIKDEYKKASVFVLSSRYEGFGLVLTEAMSQGCACVACDYLGRQSEIVTDNVSGLICEPNNVSMLAEKIDELLSNTAKREEIQKNAIKALDKFHINNVVMSWENLLIELCDKK